MRHSLAILFLLLGPVVHAAELMPASDLMPPAASDGRRVAEIREVGLAWWVKNRGLLAEESPRVAGSFAVVRPMGQFAGRDDRVREVRIIQLQAGGPTGILWSHTRPSKS
jgi:hypothetical protein